MYIPYATIYTKSCHESGHNSRIAVLKSSRWMIASSHRKETFETSVSNTGGLRGPIKVWREVLMGDNEVL